MSLFERQLPDALAVLNELAADLHWSWDHAGDQLWQRINEDVWRHTHNPVSVLQLTSDKQLAELADDKDFLNQLNNLVEVRHEYLTGHSWYARNYSHQIDAAQPKTDIRGIAYFSMEFGLCDALPLYAGGLGMLAGDYLKTASDLGVPLVGIGLLYQEGYFRQSLDGNGWQQETYLFNDPGSLPLRPLQAEDGSWLHIDTEFLCRRVRFRVWQAQVGRVTLYLLDSNDPRNQPIDRGITSKLYGGSTELRLVQEIALGICGWRLVDRLGLDIDICHLNEGHAAFATLERVRTYSERHKVDFWQALWATRAGNVFTTHTPVVAGFDRYPVDLLTRYISEFAQHLGITMESLISLGRAIPTHKSAPIDPGEPFNMAYLALNTCALTNGVSRLHGKVSRRIFQPLFPRWPEREVPVTHVTNGVHIPTWDSPHADAEWIQVFGKDRWRSDLCDVKTNNLDAMTDVRLWQMAAQGRAHLVNYARQRLARQWRYESVPPSYTADTVSYEVDTISCAVDTESALDPNILTIGFARRFAEYKRPDLLLHDPERLARLLNNSRYPLQIIIAGKAHPADNSGKRALQRWHDFVNRDDVAQHAVFIEDYDIELAQALVQGVDLWLNNPRRPWEASGTSGMKILVNGGLNLSTLDGWWAEAYEPGLGWALGDIWEHDGEGDAHNAEELYRLLENEIAPLFYERDSDNMPRAWLAYVRASMAQLTTRFSSNRMIKEYIDNLYLPAAAGLAARQHNEGAKAQELQNWYKHLHQHWHEIHLSNLRFSANEQGLACELSVYLGALNPEAIAVELVADSNTHQPAQTITLTLAQTLEGATHAYLYRGQIPAGRQEKDFTARVITAHPQAWIPSENRLIHWQTGA
jgi:starch phosphorylase